jgi:hypothetical protein
MTAPLIVTDAPKWWQVYDNVVLLTRWLADNGHDAQQVAYAVEKPWKYGDEFSQAQRDLEEDK